MTTPTAAQPTTRPTTRPAGAAIQLARRIEAGPHGDPIGEASLSDLRFVEPADRAFAVPAGAKEDRLPPRAVSSRGRTGRIALVRDKMKDLAWSPPAGR